MRRRTFIAALGGGAAAWPLVARAQQPDRMRRIGALMVTGESSPDVPGFVLTFEQQLNSLGWSKGRNLRVDYRWGAADPERIRDYATELISLSPDVLLAFGTPSLVQLRKQTSTIPIVFTVVSDPIGQGFVASLAQPGGNIRRRLITSCYCARSNPPLSHSPL
jgi:putative tryptophan/tyrosine transport system substrate-binding protein